MSKIQNYTTEIHAAKSISQIEQMLLEIGATGFAKEYAEQKVKAIRFMVEIPGAGSHSYIMPAKPDEVYSILTKGRRIKQKSIANYWQQAERTTWRIIRDWVEIQCTMVKLKQAEAMEIFLPYLLVGKNQTAFQAISASGYKLLGDGK